ncbi:DUF1275 family protein [Paraburkholderia aromaticivorans]|uniref:DUF1275 family protein n=1 Tax=Paraburkholderia aromaticivorans TaxID=2026199 RepID=UPI0038B919A2
MPINYFRGVASPHRADVTNRRLGRWLAFVAGAANAGGFQNAIIAKISIAEIRTTHVIGLVTDIGIELGKLIYWNVPDSRAPRVRADRQRLVKHIGFIATLPLAAVLRTLAVVPLLDGMRGASHIDK